MREDKLMLPRDYIIGFIMFGFSIMIVVSLLMGVYSADPSTPMDIAQLRLYNSTLNNIDQVDSLVSNYSKPLSADLGLIGSLGALGALVNNAWQMLKNLPMTVINVFTGIGNYFSIPSWIPATVFAIVTILIVFSILSAIFQRDI